MIVSERTVFGGFRPGGMRSAQTTDHRMPVARWDERGFLAARSTMLALRDESPPSSSFVQAPKFTSKACAGAISTGLEYALKFVNAPIELWECFPDTDAKLDDCTRPQIQAPDKQLAPKD